MDLTSAGAARLFNLSGKGRLAAGYDADFTLIDLKAERVITDAMSCSGKPLSRTAGKMWDTVDKIGLDDARAFGNTVVTADDKMREEYYRLVGPIETAWLADAQKKGVDGAKVLEELRAIARAY